MTLRILFAGIVAGIVSLTAVAADAQPIGTFRWQLQPFCNVVTVNVTQQGAVYTMDGYDDQCGATRRAPIVGLGTPNPDGTIGLAGTSSRPPAGAACRSMRGSRFRRPAARGATAPAMRARWRSAPAPAAARGRCLHQRRRFRARSRCSPMVASWRAVHKCRSHSGIRGGTRMMCTPQVRVPRRLRRRRTVERLERGNPEHGYGR